MNLFRQAFFSVFMLVSACASMIYSNQSYPQKPDLRFDKALKVIMIHEGGLSNNKNDPGGYTNYGISLRFLKNEQIDINGDGKINSDDVIQLTRTDADKIYLKKWYLRYHYNRIKNDNVMIKVMDGSVNFGASRMHKILGRAINYLELDPIDVPGSALDERTLMSINECDPNILITNIRSEEAIFYKSLVAHNRDLKPFLKGWLRRAAS